MAGAIKGITIEFGADVTGLNGALKKTQSALNKTQSELKQVNRALKFNPSNTTLLKQKFDLLKQSVNQTEEKLKQLRNMEKTMNAAGIDKNSAQYRELQREIIKTEDKLKSAQGELRQFGSVGKQQALAVGNAFKKAGNKIKSAGRTITTSVSVYGMAGIYAGSKLIEMANKQAEAENKLTEIYKTRMGATKGAANGTMQLASALQKQGVVGDEVALSWAQQMATYSSTPSTVNKLMPAFENLLVQQKGLNGTQEDAVGLANMFGKAMMGQAGALKRAGISFTDAQAEVLKYGTEEEKASMLAEVITQNVGNMNSEFAKTDAGKIQQAKNALGDMGEEIGAILLPAVADLVSWLQDNLMPKMQQLIDYFKQHPQVAKFALAFAAITAVLGPVIMIIGAFVSAIGGIITIAPVVAGAIGAISAPVLAVVAAIAAAIAIGVALYKNWGTVKKYALKIWGDIKKKITKLVETIKTSVTNNFIVLKNTITTIWNGIKTIVTTVVTGIKNTIVNVFNAVKTFITTVVTTIKTTLTNAWTTIKTVASTAWIAIKNAITKPIQQAKETINKIITAIKNLFPLKISSAWKGIKGLLTRPITEAKETVSGLVNKIKGFFPINPKSAWSGIKELLVQPISDAKEKITGFVDKIKGLFPLSGFKFFKEIKLPHLKITDKGKIPFGVLGKGRMPKWEVNWYKKANKAPYMFGNATLFGAGEAGDEILYGRNALMRDMVKAVGQAMGGGSGQTIINVYGSDGMSVNDLAAAVEQRIIMMQKRKSQAWA